MSKYMSTSKKASLDESNLINLNEKYQLRPEGVRL
jgi:hypothetical protein